MLHPGEAMSSSSGLELTMANLELDSLAAPFFGEQAGGYRLRFDALAPITPAYPDHWSATSRFLSDVLTDPELFRNEMMIRRGAVDLVFASAVAAFGITMGTSTTSLPAGRRACAGRSSSSTTTPIARSASRRSPLLRG